MEPYILERPEHPVSRRDIDPNVLKVLYRLINAGHVAYLVGGSVRDLMLARRPKDFDVGTSAHPHEVRALFRNSRLIGRRFRLVHVFFGPQNIEVATFRRPSEQAADDGELLIRQDNTFGTPEQDAIRRDFTVNALFYDPRTYRVIDYVGALPDLRARLIRTVGDPERRMREDPVRMMRAVRFAAKLGFEIEPATREAIERHREELLKASVPRLVEEVYRTLTASGAATALGLMEQLGLLEVLLPRLSEHLRAGRAPARESRTGRNVEALQRAVAAGPAPPHALTLACLFLDLYLHLKATEPSAGAAAHELIEALRQRGFARGDTEHVRLLLESFPRMLAPGRRLRALARRPYFAEARQLYRLAASNYKADPGALERFLASQPRPARHHAPPPAAMQPARRRHRRRSRRRRRAGAPPLVESTADGAPAPADRSNPPPPGLHPAAAQTRRTD